MGIKFDRRLLFSMVLTVSLGPLTGQVWPGDVNNNGIVNGVDLLYLGTVYGLTGPARAEVETNWSEQPLIEAWGSFFPNGVNHAFADCNGDGVVDADDIEEALKDNIGETHPGSGEADYNNGLQSLDIPVSLSPSVSFDNGDLILKIGVSLGNEDFAVQDFYGIALQLSYTSSLIDEADFSFALTEDSWIDGPAQENSAVLFEEDDDAHTAELAITLTDPSQRRSGLGRIGEFSIVMEDIIVGLIRDTMSIQIDSITLLNAAFSKIAVVPDTISFILSEDQLILSDEAPPATQSPNVQLYPNPNQGQFLIKADEPIENIRVFDLLGRRVPSHIFLLGSGRFSVEMPKAPPGTYMVSGRTANATFTKKVINSN